MDGRGDRPTTTRRGLLRLAGAGGLAGGVGLSGCLGGLLGDGGGAAVDRWLYEPGAVGAADHYTVSYARTAPLVALEDDLPDGPFQRIAGRFGRTHDATGVDFDETTGQLAFQSAGVMPVDHDPETVAEELAEEGYGVSLEDYRGFDVYLSAGVDHAVAIDGSAIVAAGALGDDDPQDVAEAVIDAGAGEGDRYVDAISAAGTLFPALLGGDLVTASTYPERSVEDRPAAAERGLFDREVGRGLRADLGDPTAVEVLLAFADADAVDREAVETWTGTDAFDAYEEVTVSVEGPIATVSARRDLGSVVPSLPRAPGRWERWILAPGLVDDSEHYSVRVTVPSAIAPHEEHFAQDTWDFLRESTLGTIREHAGIAYGDVDRSIEYGPVEVALAEYAPEDVRGALDGAGFDAAGSEAGYGVYESGYAGTAVALGDGVIVAGETTEVADARAVLETVLDARRGAAELYVDASPDFAVLSETVGDGPYVFGGTNDETEVSSASAGSFAGQVAAGARYDFEGADTGYREVRVFASEAAVDPAAIRTYVEESSTFGSFSGTETATEGRTAIVTGTVPTNEL